MSDQLAKMWLAQTPEPGSFVISLLPLILIFAIFWFLVIRPMRQQQKRRQEIVDNLKRGDKVVSEDRFNFAVDGFAPRDISILAEHLLRPGVGDLVYQQNPDKIVEGRTYVLPPALETPARGRDAVLVLDRSGAMGGWQMVAARRAAGARGGGPPWAPPWSSSAPASGASRWRGGTAAR